MEFVDEKIIEFINQSELMNEINDIYDEKVKIGNRYYEFEDCVFFDEKIKVRIPKDFEDMDQKSREIKYPSVFRPEVIKTDKTGSINITFNKIDQELEEDMVEELTKGMKSIIKNMNPSNVFYSEGIKEVYGKNIGYFEFKSTAIDEFIYNIMFFFEFEKKVLMGSFSCRYVEYQDWKEIAMQIIQNIKVQNQD